MIVNPKEAFESYREPVFTGIPDELKGYRQWVVWKLETTQDNQEKGKKPTKIPYSPLTHRKSGVNDSYQATWGTFEEACIAFSTGKYSGIMLNITDSDPFVVIDFDHCVAGGEINEEVEGYIQSLDSYTEISPSGTGIHVIVRGKKPGSRCKKQWPDYEVEMYEHGRFITITGHVVDEKHFVNQDQDALQALYNERLPENKPKVTNTVAPVPVNLDDNALLEKIRGSRQGAKFDALMAGNTAGHSTKNNEGHSEADLALCSMLAWWTGKDAERIDRIFRSSGLIRPKWDEQRGDHGTYGQMTIRTAIEGTEGQYTGGKAQKSNVVQMRKKQTRSVQVNDTGFQNRQALFPEPYPWPDTGSSHYIDPVSGALYRGQPDDVAARDLIALRPIWIHSLANDEFGEAYRIIKFCDQDLKEKLACFPAQWFSKTKDANLWASLMAQGMITMSGKEKYVSRYLDLMSSHCTMRSWAASKLGWFEVDNDEVESNPVFVLPDRVIGHTGDSRDVFFQSTQDVNSKSIATRGTLKDWQQTVVSKAKDNYLIMFAVAAGLAGAMTKLSGTSSGGFHFWGISTSGKTALLQCAASVWGNGSDPQVHSRKTSIRKWNSTVSGLEATAQLHNDIVLCLDEVSELEPADLGKLIYNLTGGTPKGRSTEIGGLRNQAYWHIMLLSSGEASTEQILKSVGQSKKGGQTHRMPDIRVDALEDGIVQTQDEPDLFVKELKENCSNYYGTAGPVFVSWLIKEMEKKGQQKFIYEIKSNIRLMKDHLCSGINPLPREIARVLERMAAIAVAAMYAAEAGILDWNPELIQKSIVFVRDLWLSDMEEEVSELDKALSELRSNMITNLANFEDLSDASAKLPIKMMGYKNYDYIMVLPKVLDDFCNNYSKRQLLKELEVKGFMSLGEFDKKTNRHKIAKKIPSRQDSGKVVKERPRCYWIARHFLDG